MGKALLILVLGGSVMLARQLYNTSETEARTGQHQAAYQEEVIAREIAASSFNVAMGEIRSFGEDIKTGAETFNGAAGKQSGTFGSGRFAGGTYETYAELTSGHSVRVVSTGTFGDAEFTMHDEYRIPALVAREDGIVAINPGSSDDPDVCSAIFYQAYPIGTDASTAPPPEMIYASSTDPRGGKHAIQSVYATAGTQMNFFLAIDADCSYEIDTSTDECADEVFASTYTFDASHWDSIHYALDVSPDDVDQAAEGAWAFVEQDASNRQSWRIAWEDQHDWNAPDDDDPHASLQALKSDGYDGAGWSLSGSEAYVALADQGDDRPDFADQSLTVEVYKVTNPNFKGKQKSVLAKQKKCGLPLDEALDGGNYDLDEDGFYDIGPNAGEAVTTATSGTTSGTEGGSTTTADPPSETADEDGFTHDELTTFACSCTSNGTKSDKAAILHRPPGNEANEQLICIGTPAVDDHFENHNDVFPTCNAGGAASRNNGKKQ